MQTPLRLLMTLLTLWWLAWPVVADRRASVLYTYETVSDKAGIEGIARALNTTPMERPGKSELLDAFRSSDVLYINAHTYSGRDHPQAHGAIVTGGGYRNDPANNLLRPDEVRQAVSGKPPQLVVLAGCSASTYGWPQAIGGTVIAFKTEIRGAGSDIVFRYFFEIWTQRDISLQDALDRAFEAAATDPSIQRMAGGVLSNIYDLPGLRRSVDIHGNPNLRYKDVLKGPPPPPPALTSLDLSGVIISEHQGRYECTVQFFSEGLPPGQPVTVSYSGEVTGPGGYRKGVNDTITVPSCGYQAGSFEFSLPQDAEDGVYEVTLTLRAGTLASLPRAGRFTRATPALTTGFKGDQQIEEGATASVITTISGGKPPYRWQWSAPGGGDSGGGNSFTMQSQGKQPFLVFNVKVWDSGRNASTPRVDNVRVAVNKPAAVELSASIIGPSETAVERNETYTLNLKGGVPPYQAEWYTGYNSFPGNPNSTLYFGQAGQATLQAKIWDQDKYRQTPLIVSTSVLVHDKLRGAILGPDEVAPGQKVDLNFDVTGGKQNLRWAWTTSSGHQITERTLSGKALGNAGDVKVITLDFEDSLNPPQKLHLEKRILLKAPANQILITGMQVDPATFAPGDKVRVRAFLTVTGFHGPNALCDTTFWMESASGSGRGFITRTDHSVPQDSPYEIWQEFNTDPKGTGGPVTATVKIQVGDVVATRSCTAQMKRPGGLEDITVDSRTVTLTIWDHGAEDGDIVSIFINDHKLGQGKITKAGARFTLNLNPGPNTLRVLAHNEGTSSPNTAAVSITNVVRGPAQQSYSLKTGAQGYFQITAP